MRRVISKLFAVFSVLLALGAAIGATDSELWLGVWMIAFIYVAIPVLLLTIADLIRVATGNQDREKVLSTGIHVTAVFAFIIGYFVYKMSVWSEHPMVDRHAYLPILFVAIVYGFPTYLMLRDRLTKTAVDALKTEEVLELPTSRENGDERT